MKIGFLNALTIVFIVLKLCKIISWSWWLILLPTIVSCGLVILILVVFLILEMR